MPKNIELNRRTVGTQSDLEIGENNVSIPGTVAKRGFNKKFSGLCKKSAYRNLLQGAIIVEVHGKLDLTLDSVKNEKSRATQTAENGSVDDNRKPRLRREESLEIPIEKSQELSPSPSLLSQEFQSISEDNRSAKVRYDDMPGTSRLISLARSSSSPQQSLEGSLAVIYSCGEKQSLASKISNLPYFNQPTLRRQSDETVLLVQDYQSYDVLNAARWQDVPDVHDRRGKVGKRKKKRSRARKEGLTRPKPIPTDSSLLQIYVCRICHEGEDSEPLIRPCLCKGSVGYIHAKCLKLWLEQSNTSRCEICGYPYAIRQTRKYRKCFSVSVFIRTIANRRSLTYDLMSFLAVTPLCVVGIAMCIRTSIVSGAGFSGPGPNFHLGNVTRAGMMMLSTTIVIAYGVWLYTLLSYHYKSWKRWYNGCYDVEVIPVNMSSEERLEALRKLEEETRRRSSRTEHRGSGVGVLQPVNSYGNFFQRRLSIEQVHRLPQ